MPELPLSRVVAGYRRSHKRGSDAQLFSSRRTLRIRHTIGLYSSSVPSISPLRTGSILSPLNNFHELSRAIGPDRHTR
jgi:hypothetical protein